MRILIAHSAARMSGVITFMATVGAALKNAGHIVDYALYCSAWPSPEELNAVLNEFGGGADWQFSEDGYFTAPPEAYHDLVISNSRESFVRTGAEKRARAFVVHGLHNPELMPADYFEADTIICLSEVAFNAIKAPGRALKKLAGNYINTELFKPESEPAAIPLKVLIADMLYAPLYMQQVITACSGLGLYCSVAGHGLHGLEPRVNMAAAYNSADLVIGYGRVLYEAMACGRPVISYGVNGGDGYLSPADYPAARRHNCSGWGLRRMPPPAELKPYDFFKQITLYKKEDGAVNRQLIIDDLAVPGAPELISLFMP